MTKYIRPCTYDHAFIPARVQETRAKIDDNTKSKTKFKKDHVLKSKFQEISKQDMTHTQQSTAENFALRTIKDTQHTKGYSSADETIPTDNVKFLYRQQIEDGAVKYRMEAV
jgi:hypothetical protein